MVRIDFYVIFAVIIDNKNQIIKLYKMKSAINQLAVLDRAKTMVLKGYNLNQSLTTSSMIELLQLQLMSGTAQFIYQKKNGELRKAFGTLLEKVVNNNINGCGVPRSYFNCQAYFDIEEQAWRSFKYENLVTILN